MVTDSNCIYHENHVVMYINITSLFCTFETNRILHANYMPIKRKGLVGTREIKSGERALASHATRREPGQWWNRENWRLAQVKVGREAGRQDRQHQIYVKG